MPRYKTRPARFFVSNDGVVRERTRHLGKRERMQVFERDGWRCRYCGIAVTTDYIGIWCTANLRKAQVDHIVSVSRGGQNDPANVVTACGLCNMSKGALDAAPRLMHYRVSRTTDRDVFCWVTASGERDALRRATWAFRGMRYEAGRRWRHLHPHHFRIESTAPLSPVAVPDPLY